MLNLIIFNIVNSYTYLETPIDTLAKKIWQYISVNINDNVIKSYMSHTNNAFNNNKKISASNNNKIPKRNNNKNV